MSRPLSEAHRLAISRALLEHYAKLREQQQQDPELKRCSKCGKWKNRKKGFLMRPCPTRMADGSTKVYWYPRPECRYCNAKRAAQHRAKLKASGKFAEAQARWETTRDIKHTRRVHRDWYRKRQGSAFTRPWKKYLHEVKQSGPSRFDAKAVAEFIEHFIVLVPIDEGRDEQILNGFKFAVNDQRRFRAWKHGETKRITLETLDEWATRYELPFWELEEVGKIAA